MRPFATVLEEYRIRDGPYKSDRSCGWCGAWRIPYQKAMLAVISSDGADPDARAWEHVSVHVFDQDRCPIWEEMCYIKDLFWTSEECVVQFHPPKSRYVNKHPFTLHLWRKRDFVMPVPDLQLV